MIKLGLKPILFVLNNEGYTIERCIHGKNRCVLATQLPKATRPYRDTESTTTSRTGTGLAS